MLAGAAATALLVGGGCLYAARERAPQPSQLPPSQRVRITYEKAELPPPSASTSDFSFSVLLTTKSGPPVTVAGISQPYDAISLSSTPRTPFPAGTGPARRIAITMHVLDCSQVPGNAGLPFLDVTLRNTDAMENHSFILGERYAQDVSRALRSICAHPAR